MRIIITGCYGFIGFNFLNYLVKNYPKDFYIVGIDSLENKCSKINAKKFTNQDNFNFIESDICKINDLDFDFKGFDTVVNFAAESHVDNSIRNPEKFINSNILGTSKVFQNSLENNIENNLHISTDEIYGSTVNKYFVENDNMNPSSPYSASKASAEMICMSYIKTYGMNINILRPANNYGIYQQPEKLIPFSILNLINGNNIEIYGEGKNVRHWLHVEDTCRGILHILESKNKNEVYNIGSGEYLTNLDLAHIILDKLDLDNNRLSFIEDRPGHDFRYAIDFLKLEETGWKPTFNLVDSIDKIIEWYQENRTWWESEYKTTLENRKTRFNLN